MKAISSTTMYILIILLLTLSFMAVAFVMFSKGTNLNLGKIPDMGVDPLFDLLGRKIS